MPARSYDAVVIGAGAAGMMCAIAAGKRGRRVAVLERGTEAGRKILISGGGRCNFTNFHCRPENFLSANPHFAKSALARYTAADFIALVRAHHIAFHEKTLGQLFCDGAARQIVQMLMREAATAGVEVFTGCEIAAVSHAGGFRVESSLGSFDAPSLVLASGGVSIPKMGASDFAFRTARQFGLKIREPRPALVPLLFAPAMRERFVELAGVSAEAEVVCGKQRFREQLLFTHRGLSGPAVLQISSYWKPGAAISIDLSPAVDLGAALLARKRAGDRATLKTALAEWLPKRLAELMAPATPLHTVTDAAIQALAGSLHRWSVTPSGTEGFEKAEVTAGGIDTAELSSQSMESRRLPGLYCIGEAVDVTGHLGGFNFQWAWSSGHAAGVHIR